MSEYGGGGRGRGQYYKEKYGGGRGGRGGRGGGGGGGGGGRGEYYKNKYGGGGGGGGGGGYQDRPHTADGSYGGGSSGGEPVARTPRTNGSIQDLKGALHNINGRQYPCYKDLIGAWTCSEFTLVIDKVQSDPFAPPSRCRVIVPPPVAAFPVDLHRSKVRATGLADYLLRKFYHGARSQGMDEGAAGGGGWHGSKGGNVNIECPSQHILERTAVRITPQGVEARFTVALPAQGRTIQGNVAANILTEQLPRLVNNTLRWATCDQAAVQRHVISNEDQDALRKLLPQQGLIGFVIDGAILPRKSGASDEPMEAKDKPVPFQGPQSMKISLQLPNRGAIEGMGIRPGITLIVGGGFHGKSTLMEALEVGVYNHVPNDGREFVCMVPDAVKIRAEDGRSVAGVNISPFISNLPFGKGTSHFSTPDASGSTSQAANIIEALEVEAKVLLMDEDTCATNFMVRDRRMQQLVAKNKEPITPFISKVRQLWQDMKVSSVLVIGGSGDYFDVADEVVMMESYTPRDVSAEARKIAADFPGTAAQEGGDHFGTVTQRCPSGQSVSQATGGNNKIVARTKAVVSFGETELDLSGVEQIVEHGQTRAIADILLYAGAKYMNGTKTLKETLAAVCADMDKHGIDAINPDACLGTYSRPRLLEIAQALNRLRGVTMRS